MLRTRRVGGAVVLAAVLVASPLASTPPAQPPAASSPGVRVPDGIDLAPLLPVADHRACMRRVLAATGPAVTVVGASFTAGVGAGAPQRAWAIDLARRLRWRAVVAGDPGIGYTHLGADRTGPLGGVLPLLDLARSDPRLLIIQAGHDDWRTPPAREAITVRQLVGGLHRDLPGTTLVLLTAFVPSRGRATRALRADRAIVTAARAADPGAVVLDPHRLHWRFDRAGGGDLHPSARGAAQIASLVVTALARDGISPTRGPTRPPVCDLLVTPGR